MKATQFRIGNILADKNGNPIIMEELLQNYYNSKGDFSTLYRDAKPIPITEEWLLKFGFDRKKFTDGSEYLEIDKTVYNKIRNPIHSNNEFWKCYRFQFFKNEWYFGIYKDPNSNQFFVQKKIRYIHQLQNLYFALTDEELEIK